MAAYAALVSLMHIIEQIKHHPRPPISLDKTQVESLTEKVTFLQEFLEGYSHVAGYTKEADPLELRITDAAYAAEDVIESHIVDQIHAGIPRSRHRKISSVDLFEGLQKVIEEMDLLKKEVMEIKENIGGVSQHLQRISTPVESLRSSSNIAMVGFGDVLIEVMDELTRGHLDRRIISIVGMGGIGKTTLARNVCENKLVRQYFGVLVWVTISQDYSVKEILSQLLQEAGGGSTQMDEYKLGENLYKELSGRRYLIVLDDIWDIQVWDKLRRFFPDNKNGSRIVITTRISDFQVTGSYVIKMGFLNEDQSWSLFSKIVFGKESCPVEMEEMGKKIVENCGGLPLSIVVVGGLLAKSEYTQEYWEYIAENLNSIVNSEDDERCLKILHLSYNQLPVNLKPCFLYMGVFPEDKKIRVSKLIHLWVVEGFLKPINGKSLEVIADEYVKELINRNLILVHELGCIGNIKYCNIHDLLRDLCLKEAQKQRFYGVIRQSSLDVPQERRVVIPNSTKRVENAMQSTSLVRSLICEFDGVLPFLNFRLLRILSYTFFHYGYTLENMFGLVNSRYLVLDAPPRCKFPSSVHRLWNLHTLVIKTGKITAPSEIWNMSQLRHFVSESGIYLPSPPVGENNIVMKNLQMLGRIMNFKCCDEVVKRIPNIKKLIAYYDKFDKGCLSNLGKLHQLESLKCLSFLDNLITFPHSLKKLTISIGPGRPVYWEDLLESIGALPLLEKLIFRFGCFKGKTWETVEGQFLSLKFLKIVDCDSLIYWETESSHFPRLEHLVLQLLEELEEIPSDIGEIPTLKSIKLVECTNSAAKSAKDMLDEQEDTYGVVSLEVQVRVKDFEQKEELQMLASPNFQFI